MADIAVKCNFQPVQFFFVEMRCRTYRWKEDFIVVVDNNDPLDQLVPQTDAEVTQTKKVSLQLEVDVHQAHLLGGCNFLLELMDQSRTIWKFSRKYGGSTAMLKFGHVRNGNPDSYDVEDMAKKDLLSRREGIAIVAISD